MASSQRTPKQALIPGEQKPIPRDVERLVRVTHFDTHGNSRKLTGPDVGVRLAL